jgi:hypothetical protein
MLNERDLQRVAAKSGTPLRRFDKSGRRLPGSSETYVGDVVVDAICMFARETTSASSSRVEGKEAKGDQA